MRGFELIHLKFELKIMEKRKGGPEKSIFGTKKHPFLGETATCMVLSSSRFQI